MCLTRGGVREGAGGGDCVGDKPAEMKACNGGPCVSTVTWYSSPWTQVRTEEIFKPCVRTEKSHDENLQSGY